MNTTKSVLISAAAILSLVLSPARTRAASATLTFDDVSSLAQYAPLGVTFSANASIWSSTAPSVLTDPNGGAYTVPNALQFNRAGGVAGTIFFSSAVDDISVWALSGPGPDLLSSPMYVRAFDALGNEIGRDDVNPSLQFDFLSITAPGIRRLEFFSPEVNDDVWDNLTFTPVPEPAAVLLLPLALAVIGCRLFKRAKE